MSVVKTWKAFIKAQEIFINQYSEPFSIVFKGDDRNGLRRFEIQQKHPLTDILPFLKKSFPGIIEHDVNLEKGYLLYDSNRTPINTAELDDFARSNYFEFDYRPCFTGTVGFKVDPFKWLENAGAQRENQQGYFLATLKSIERIDQEMIQHEGFSRSAAIGCIIRVRPSKRYLRTFQEANLSTFLSTHFSAESYSFTTDKGLAFKNIFLLEKAVRFIKVCGYSKSSHEINIRLDENSLKTFQEKRVDFRIFYTDEIKNTTLSNIAIFPPPINNCFCFIQDDQISSIEVESKVEILRRLFTAILESKDFVVEHKHVFQLDENVHRSSPFDTNHFYNHFQEIIADDAYRVSIDKNTVSFDFASEEELNARIQLLQKIDIAELDFKGVEHAFKVRVEFITPLAKIQDELLKIPAIKTKLTNNSNALKFFCSFNDQALHTLLVTKIKNTLDPIIEGELEYSFDEVESSKLKYFLNFLDDEFQNDITSKFNYLKGEDIIIKGETSRSPIGSIVKVDFPNVLITTIDDIPLFLGEERDDADESGKKLCAIGTSITVQCQLKGERDKIKRLADTIDIIFNVKRSKLLNEKLKSILIDSATAKSFPGNILLSADYKETLEGISLNQLSKNINESQKQAIAKSLLAEDFFIIQGPPGTGKSTAIAELIWQHLRVNLRKENKAYRVLVTSETNLAVDNALDKLRSKDHLLIKPLRFGSDEKMDKEGKRFSLEALRNWASHGRITDQADEFAGKNILEDWIGRIIERVKASDNEIPDIVRSRWVDYLSEPDLKLKEAFLNTYLEHANVFGATCSSIGKETSDQRFTRFYTDYCSIVHSKEYTSFRSAVTKTSINELKKKAIEFDLVVQDEASKASPPELALPCLFGRKAVVIGDHRQLPPMVDTNDFLDNLKLVKAKTREDKNRAEIDRLITFIKQNKEEFAVSHFEKLFKHIDPNLKASFNIQYRMHPAINETVKQFYVEDGGLVCGIPEDVANSSDLSHPLNRFHGVTANKNTHIVWLDVDTPEIIRGTSRFNPGEVNAIDWLLATFRKSPGYKKFMDFWPTNEIDQKQIGIITFYGAQASALSKMADKYSEIPIRISPVDRFQGMERNIVIVSLVRSDKIATTENQSPDFEGYPVSGFPKQHSLGFAEFPNRLNVALSRAKRLLIIVGNSRHFRRHPIYDKVYETISNHKNGVVKVFDAKSLNT
jgi:DNA polymerase alpha-associated DNA helicase A